jgi:NIMA (never in mitosis gene a)-related kinase
MANEKSDNYLIGKEIGEGGYGKVYHGYDRKIELSVCIKELNLLRKGGKWNAENEIKILKTVNHPNIIKHLDDYQLNDKQYIVMELIETGTLSTLIEEYQLANKFIPEKLILKYFSQLISVLNYLYDKRIIHRDIKANNILYMKSNVLKLADFGIARVVSEDIKELQSTDGSSRGSVGYASPEVSKGDYYFFPTDIWSLGVVMYQLMSLELPFEGSNSRRTHHLIINDDYLTPPIEGNYSEELKQVVYQILEKDQYKRIHIEELFENPLFSKIDLNQNPFKFFLSGVQLLTGSKEPTRFETVSNLFKASADLDDPRGLWSYGLALEEGYNGKIDLPEAMNYFKMLADLGNSKGMLNYGIALSKGYNGKINLPEAMNYF